MVKRKKRLAPFSILCSLLKAVMHCMHVPRKSTCSLPSLWFCFFFSLAVHNLRASSQTQLIRIPILLIKTLPTHKGGGETLYADWLKQIPATKIARRGEVIFKRKIILIAFTFQLGKFENFSFNPLQLQIHLPASKPISTLIKVFISVYKFFSSFWNS